MGEGVQNADELVTEPNHLGKVVVERKESLDQKREKKWKVMMIDEGQFDEEVEKAEVYIYFFMGQLLD